MNYKNAHYVSKCGAIMNSLAMIAGHLAVMLSSTLLLRNPAQHFILQTDKYIHLPYHIILCESHTQFYTLCPLQEHSTKTKCGLATGSACSWAGHCCNHFGH